MGKFVEIPILNIKDKYIQKEMTRLNEKLLPAWSDYLRRPHENQELLKLPYPYKLGVCYASYHEYVRDDDEAMSYAPFDFICFKFQWGTQKFYTFHMSKMEVLTFQRCNVDALHYILRDRICEILSSLAGQSVYVTINPDDYKFSPSIQSALLEDFHRRKIDGSRKD